MQAKLTFLMVLIGLGLIVVSQSVFIVDEREQALVLQLGQPVGDIKGPGLHFKIPVVQDVTFFDRRILSVDPRPEQVVVSSSQKTQSPNTKENEGEENAGGLNFISGEPLLVDTFARYKITDALGFYKSLRSTRKANEVLEQIMNEATRSVLGRTTLSSLLSEQRTQIMAEILGRVNKKVQDDELGIEIVDIRIVRADLTPELRVSTVNRMRSELEERATESRANGQEQAKIIRAEAEKDRTVLLANAERDAQIIRGKGDEKAISTYVKAFNKDPEFYSFIRSMEAYQKTLSNPETQLVLSPDSEFLKFIKDK